MLCVQTDVVFMRYVCNARVEGRELSIFGSNIWNMTHLFFEDKNSKVQSMNSMIVVPITSNLGRITAPIIFSIPLQLLSYHVALIRETDVDKPRNLAKSVTVE